MSKLEAAVVTRTLTVVLPEAEWHALRSVEPDAVGWLRGQIRERLGSPEPGRPESPPASADPRWNTDQY